MPERNASIKSLAIVTETYRPDVNGVARTLGKVTDTLRSCYQLQVICPQANTSAHDAASSDIDWQGVGSAPIPGYPDMRFGFPCGRRLQRLWKENRPDAVYIATPGPLGWSALAAANRLGIPVSTGFHTNFHHYAGFYGFGWIRPLLMTYLKRFHNRSHWTLVPTMESASMLQSMGIKNTRTWGRGIDTHRFHPSHRCEKLRADWGADEDIPVYLYVGRIAAEKNIELAIQAYRRVRSEKGNARLIVVGNGPMLAQLKEKNRDIIFTGEQTGMALSRIYASADIFLFPSLTDTFGNVVLEACASGLAPIAFNNAAAREHLVHEESGLLASNTDRESFVHHALALALRPRFRARIRKEARSAVESLSWETLSQRFADLILANQEEQPSYGQIPRRRTV